MYLISIYFDEKTDKRIRQLIKQVAEKTGNTFMIDNDIPPHITVAAMETRDEDAAIATLDKCMTQLRQGDLRIVSVGAFLPQVIYLEPVLNEYLHNLAVVLSEELKMLPDTKMSTCYQPFSWLPHITIGKQLTEEQMRIAFETLQKHFVPLTGTVTRIGIAKPNPHRDLKVWELEK
ncbi:MAG: 2'-5' RNA ligase family protein [Roseburia sp.]|nr:2'-5' RNA ligase family protein [Roseburia sp.]